MAKSRLSEMRIRPAKDGSHNVRHEFESAPKLAKGALTGGMMMDRPEPEEHNFGPKDGKALMQHIANALALRDVLSGQDDEEPQRD
jgi:hypothetical protein